MDTDNSNVPAQAAAALDAVHNPIPNHSTHSIAKQEPHESLLPPGPDDAPYLWSTATTLPKYYADLLEATIRQHCSVSQLSNACSTGEYDEIRQLVLSGIISENDRLLACLFKCDGSDSLFPEFTNQTLECDIEEAEVEHILFDFERDHQLGLADAPHKPPKVKKQRPRYKNRAGPKNSDEKCDHCGSELRQVVSQG